MPADTRMGPDGTEYVLCTHSGKHFHVFMPTGCPYKPDRLVSKEWWPVRMCGDCEYFIGPTREYLEACALQSIGG